MFSPAPFDETVEPFPLSGDQNTNEDLLLDTFDEFFGNEAPTGNDPKDFDDHFLEKLDDEDNDDYDGDSCLDSNLNPRSGNRKRLANGEHLCYQSAPMKRKLNSSYLQILTPGPDLLLEDDPKTPENQVVSPSTPRAPFGEQNSSRTAKAIARPAPRSLMGGLNTNKQQPQHIKQAATATRSKLGEQVPRTFSSLPKPHVEDSMQYRNQVAVVQMLRAPTRYPNFSAAQTKGRSTYAGVLYGNTQTQQRQMQCLCTNQATPTTGVHENAQHSKLVALRHVMNNQQKQLEAKRLQLQQQNQALLAKQRQLYMQTSKVQTSTKVHLPLASQLKQQVDCLKQQELHKVLLEQQVQQRYQELHQRQTAGHHNSLLNLFDAQKQLVNVSQARNEARFQFENTCRAVSSLQHQQKPASFEAQKLLLVLQLQQLERQEQQANLGLGALRFRGSNK